MDFGTRDLSAHPPNFTDLMKALIAPIQATLPIKDTRTDILSH